MDEDPLGGRPWSKKRPLSEEDHDEGPPLKQTKACQDLLVSMDKRYWYWAPWSSAPKGYRKEHGPWAESIPEERAFMDEHKLWRPSVSQWLKQSHDRVQQFASAEQRRAIKQWSGPNYLFVNEAFRHNDPERSSIYEGFVSLFKGPHAIASPLPSDAILFEGHDEYRPCQVGDTFRRVRATSTTWTLKMGLRFADNEFFDEERKGMLYIHRFPDDRVMALNIQGEYSNWIEAEVLVQPGIMVRVDQILDKQSFPYDLLKAPFVVIVFTTVTAL